MVWKVREPTTICAAADCLSAASVSRWREPLRIQHVERCAHEVRAVESRLGLAEVRVRSRHELLRGRIQIDDVELLVGHDDVDRRRIQRLFDAFTGHGTRAIRFRGLAVRLNTRGQRALHGAQRDQQMPEFVGGLFADLVVELALLQSLEIALALVSLPAM